MSLYVYLTELCISLVISYKYLIFLFIYLFIYLFI